jgi:hypothetical protein
MRRKEVREQAALDKSTFWKDGRITVQMLWKGKFAYIPPSEAAARKRLQLLHKKLAKATPAVRAEYAKTITDDVDKGYVKKLRDKEANQLHGRHHWFLPHFIVFHPDKPDRHCRVLDCAAKVDGILLNSMLHAGRKNMGSMLGVLLPFRVHKYVINTDIKEMFLQSTRATETSLPSCGTKTRRTSQQSTSTPVTSLVRRACRRSPPTVQ